MKTKLFLLLATVALTMANVLYFPELKPVPFQWTHDRRASSPDTYYQFYAGTNLVQKVATNDNLVVTSTATNGVTTVSALISFSHALVGINATNQLSVTAFDPVSNMESDHSTNILTGQIVGKPLPPQDNRNP